MLVHLGAKVHGIVRASNTWRLKEIDGSIDINIVDITNRYEVTRFYSTVQPSVTFHTAAYGVNYADQDIERAIQVNVLGSMHLVSSAATLSNHRFINLGTRYESENRILPVRETDCHRPVGIYGTTKHAAHVIMEDIAKRKGLLLRTAILFGTYGPMEDVRKFIPYVITSLLDGISPRLTGCEQKRSYTYIEDVVEGLLAVGAVESPTVMNVNIGSGNAVSLRSVVECISSQLGTNLKAAYGETPYRDDEIWYLVPDVKFSQKVLEWSPKVSLEEGISRTIGWYKNAVQQRARRGALLS